MKTIVIYSSQDGVSPISYSILQQWVDEIVGVGQVEVNDHCEITGPDDVIEQVAAGLIGCIITEK